MMSMILNSPLTIFIGGCRVGGNGGVGDDRAVWHDPRGGGTCHECHWPRVWCVCVCVCMHVCMYLIGVCVCVRMCVCVCVYA